MSKYAQLNENNLVINVIVVSPSKKNPKQWLEKNLGGTWMQITDNKDESLYPNKVGIGHEYDAQLKGFIPPKPFASWILNETTFEFEAPIPRPEGDFDWDEEKADWVVISK